MICKRKLCYRWTTKHLVINIASGEHLAVAKSSEEELLVYKIEKD